MNSGRLSRPALIVGGLPTLFDSAIPRFAPDGGRRVRRRNTNDLPAASASSGAGVEWRGKIKSHPVHPRVPAVLLSPDGTPQEPLPGDERCSWLHRFFDSASPSR